MRPLTQKEKEEYERMIKGATQMSFFKEGKVKTLCSYCLKEVSYIEETVPIRFGFNGRDYVLIDGINRKCAKCGHDVDCAEVFLINKEQALKSRENGVKAPAANDLYIPRYDKNDKDGEEIPENKALDNAEENMAEKTDMAAGIKEVSLFSEDEESGQMTFAF